MLKALWVKIKESFLSVMPIFVIVMVLYFTPLVNLQISDLIRFILSTLFLVLGMGLFNLGADLSMIPMGENVGSGLTKTKRLGVLLSVTFVMGLLITVAEPDLTVLANQVGAIMNGKILIAMVGIGVGLLLAVAIIRIVFKKNLTMILMFAYMVVFGISAILLESGRGDLMAMAYDSGGVTTGPLTVPFIMSLGVGVSATIGGYDANENSFGLVSLCSVGPIVAVLGMSLFSKGEIVYHVPDYREEANTDIFEEIFLKCGEVGGALLLIVASFIVLQIFILKMPKKRLIHMGVGLIYTFIGLVIFLTAVSIGYMPLGYEIGKQLAASNEILIIIFGFVMGAVVVLAEPAVHVLKHQVEEITDGAVKKSSMMVALSVGVGISLGLSVIRMIFKFSVLYYLIPGYLISLMLSLFVPKLYTAIAFDSGGVASGPMTSGFILPLMIGICQQMNGEESVLSLAFGVVAMVAMTPLITIQFLGFKAIIGKTIRKRILMKRIVAKDDEQIIYFRERK